MKYLKRPTFISHRTDFFDRAVAEAAEAANPIQQFVVLGAAWDTRSYGPINGRANLAEGGTRVFEVDEPPTRAAKERALRQARVDAAHVTFAPTDFNQRTWLESLVEHGFDRRLKRLRRHGDCGSFLRSVRVDWSARRSSCP